MRPGLPALPRRGGSRARSRELTPRKACRLIDRLARFGSPLPHLVLTGGDPLKRPDLFELIARRRALRLPRVGGAQRDAAA